MIENELQTTARNAIQKYLGLSRTEATDHAARLSVGQWARLAKVSTYPADLRISMIVRIVSEGFETMLPPEAAGPAVRRVRLVRPVGEAMGTGPFNGQFALQRALRARQPDWLSIGGQPQPDELPWFWAWLDMPELLGWIFRGRPFVAGPNILFRSSRSPRIAGEDAVCDSACCRLLFTESEWYRDLIKKNLGRDNSAPIVLWPYPIEPQPEGPLPAEFDLLIYLKSGPQQIVEKLVETFPRSCLIRYGHYRREDLVDAARRSRAAVYFSDDDRGPLALAEILLTGCPAVGIPRGAPWIESGRTGELVDNLAALGPIVDAVQDLHEWNRADVRQHALEKFDTCRTVSTILDALDCARRSPSNPRVETCIE